MPFNSKGEWEYEDASVATRVNNFTASGNPLIAQARAQGVQAANRRGLMNSSIAASAAEGEAFRVATPIAMQEAQQAFQGNQGAATRASELERTNIQERGANQRLATQEAGQMGRLQFGENAATVRQREQIEASTQNQREALGAEFERLRYSNNAEDQRQARNIQAQMQQLDVTERGAMQRLNTTEAGQLQRLQLAESGANTRQVQSLQADFERLRYSTNADDQRQARQIAAQLEQLGISEAGQNARLVMQEAGSERRLGMAEAGQAARQREALVADFDRLRFSTNAADQQQARQIQAELQRLDRSEAGAMARVQVQGQIQSALQAQGAEQQQQLAAIQGDIQSRLAAQSDVLQRGRMTQEFQQNLAATNNEHLNALDRITATGNQEMRRQGAQILASWNELQANLEAGRSRETANAITSIFQTQAQMRQALLSNTAMPAAERAAYEQQISALGAPALAAVTAIYGGSAPPAGGLNAGGAVAPSPAPAGSAPAPITTPAYTREPVNDAPASTPPAAVAPTVLPGGFIPISGQSTQPAAYLAPEQQEWVGGFTQRARSIFDESYNPWGSVA